MSRIPLVKQVHDYLADIIQPGDNVIDATTGNGHDTVFLAERVGETGKVYGFDIQRQAIDATTQRLRESNLIRRVVLINAGHETLQQHLPVDLTSKVKAIVFNLGYLPGGDKSLITRGATTIEALENAKPLLAGGGVISILAYTGHPGGRGEAEAVKNWAKQQDSQLYEINITVPETEEGNAPEWVLIRRSE